MKINLDYTVLETCRDFCIAASITAKLCNQYTCTVLHVMSSADTLNSTHLNPHPFPPSARPRTPCPFPGPTSSLPHSPRTSPRRAPRPGTRPAQRRTAQTAPPAPAGDRGRRLEARMAQEEPRPRLDRSRRPTRTPARSPPTARCRGPVNDSGPGRASIAAAGPRRRRLGIRLDRRQRPASAVGRRTTRGPAAPRSPPPVRGGCLARGGGPATLLRAGGRLRIWLESRY